MSRDDVSEWKRRLLAPVGRAVYAAAVGASDVEIRAVVEDALNRARRDLSS